LKNLPQKSSITCGKQSHQPKGNNMKFLKILLFVLIPASADVLLENFSEKVAQWRNNGEGTKLFDVDNIQQPGQIANVGNGVFETKIPDTVGRGLYIKFTPRQTGYNGAGGRLRDYTLEGNWDTNLNRLSFLMRTNKDIPAHIDGSPNFQIGTYIHGRNDGDPEYPGVHYYHQANMEIKAGAWYRVVLTRLPQDKEGGSPNYTWPNDPEYPSNHYFEGMTKFYLESKGDGWQGSTVQVTDFRLSKEPEDQADEIGTLAYGYSGSAYVLTWAGKKGIPTTEYEIGYSLKPIVTWDSVTFLGTSTAPGSNYCGVLFKKTNAELTTGVYFAIRAKRQFTPKPFPFMQIYVPYRMAPVKDTVVTPPKDTVPPVCTPQIVHDTIRVPEPYPVVRIDTLFVVPRAMRSIFEP
jgi:hypothetical protein